LKILPNQLELAGFPNSNPKHDRAGIVAQAVELE